jgi:hypothetical protein
MVWRCDSQWSALPRAVPSRRPRSTANSSELWSMVGSASVDLAVGKAAPLVCEPVLKSERHKLSPIQADLSERIATASRLGCNRSVEVHGPTRCRPEHRTPITCWLRGASVASCGYNSRPETGVRVPSEGGASVGTRIRSLILQTLIVSASATFGGIATAESRILPGHDLEGVWDANTIAVAREKPV